MNDHIENEGYPFDRLEKETTPPARLEESIIAKLKSEGLIMTTRPRFLFLKYAASLAAALCLFFGGMFFESQRSAAPAGIDPAHGYMLILHEDAGFKQGEPRAMFEEYSNWMHKTLDRGVKIDGQELKNEAAIVSGDRQVAMLGADAGEKITGYFVIEAASMDEALEVAKDNPHVKYGGSIEVKPFMVR